MNRHVVAVVLGVFVMVYAFIGVAKADIAAPRDSLEAALADPENPKYETLRPYLVSLLTPFAFAEGISTPPGDPVNLWHDRNYNYYLSASKPFTLHDLDISNGDMFYMDLGVGLKGWNEGVKVCDTWLDMGKRYTTKHFDLELKDVDIIRFYAHNEYIHLSQINVTFDPDPPASVPEPPIFLVLAGGLVGIVCLRKKLFAQM